LKQEMVMHFTFVSLALGVVALSPKIPRGRVTASHILFSVLDKQS